MNAKTNKLIAIMLVLACAAVTQARIKLVALPERAATVVRLDNPTATLIEEERVLTLQKGINKIDFSWKGVSIDADSIRLSVLEHPDKVILLNVSYPPDEAALVWEINSDKDYAEKVRISYLLSNIDRLITYKAIADKAETAVDLKSYLVLRNFSGEDFAKDLAKEQIPGEPQLAPAEGDKVGDLASEPALPFRLASPASHWKRTGSSPVLIRWHSEEACISFWYRMACDDIAMAPEFPAWLEASRRRESSATEVPGCQWDALEPL